MKNNHYYRACLAVVLIGLIMPFISCGKDDDSPSSSNFHNYGNKQEQTDGSITTPNENIPEAPKLLAPKDILSYIKNSDESPKVLNMALETYDHTAVLCNIPNFIKVKLVIPEGVKTVSANRDVWPSNGMGTVNMGLIDVVFPQTITEIGDWAFSYCEQLPRIVIPKSVTVIGVRAFSFCDKLSYVSMSNGLTKIGAYSFSGCRKLTNVKIPKTVTEICSGAFENSGLTNIQIPDAVSSIDYNAFEGSNISVLEIPASVKNWGEFVFEDGHLISITIPEKITDIDMSHCLKLTSITLPDNITNIGKFCFYNCRALESIVIPDCLTSIETNTFYNCESLKSVTIPNNVTSIGYQAFSGSGLTSITIPNSVISIDGTSFYGCRNLTEIHITESLKNWYGNKYGNNDHVYRIMIADVPEKE